MAAFVVAAWKIPRIFIQIELMGLKLSVLADDSRAFGTDNNL